MATIPGKAFSPLAEAGKLWPRSTIMQSLNIMVDEIARTDIAILLVGESGTGKEVYARLIHRVSNLSSMPMKKVNCAAMDAGRLLAQIRESLGAVGGSGYGKPQTLFLDGVDELDLSCQRVLLSLLSDSEQKCGSGEAAVRFISSSSSVLEKDIEAGRFRRELYFRINGVVLRLPPLRERKEEVPILLKHFMSRMSERYARAPLPLSPTLMNACLEYSWPGNLRELSNFIKRYLILGDETLAIAELSPKNDVNGGQRADGSGKAGAGESSAGGLKSLARSAKDEAEAEAIAKALNQTNWNRKQAAALLKISYKALLYKIRQYGIAEAKSHHKLSAGA